MEQHALGSLWPVSTLTLGGGGLGMLRGPTTFYECVATVHDAVADGINLLDLADHHAMSDSTLPSGRRGGVGLMVSLPFKSARRIAGDSPDPSASRGLSLMAFGPLTRRVSSSAG
jgi:hypothetical protein